MAAASALVRLVNDEAHRRNLGRQARSYTLANFTWPAVAGKYLEVYRGSKPSEGLGWTMTLGG